MLKLLFFLIQLLYTAFELTVVGIRLAVDLASHIYQPAFTLIRLRRVAPMPFVIGQIESKRVVFGNPILFVTHVAVPSDEIDGVTKIIAIGTVIT